ncbi:MAG: hypothetical protein R2701_03640 [Acidimicrobiales bacterium]
MTSRSHRPRWLLAIGAAALAVAVCDVGAAALNGGPRAPEAVPEAVSTQPIAGTEVSVPVPDPSIGSEVHDLTIPLQDAKATVHGVAFYRPGPISGSVVGGVSVVYDDTSPMATSGKGGRPDLDAVAEAVNPGLAPERSTLAGHDVLGWPASEVVPAEGIDQQERSVSRYVIVTEQAAVQVTFDDVPADAAGRYLETLAGAL